MGTLAVTMILCGVLGGDGGLGSAGGASALPGRMPPAAVEASAVPAEMLPAGESAPAVSSARDGASDARPAFWSPGGGIASFVLPRELPAPPPHCHHPFSAQNTVPGAVPNPLGSWWSRNYLAYRGNYIARQPYDYRWEFDYPWHPRSALAPSGCQSGCARCAAQEAPFAKEPIAARSAAWSLSPATAARAAEDTAHAATIAR